MSNSDAPFEGEFASSLRTKDGPWSVQRPHGAYIGPCGPSIQNSDLRTKTAALRGCKSSDGRPPGNSSPNLLLLLSTGSRLTDVLCCSGLLRSEHSTPHILNFHHVFIIFCARGLRIGCEEGSLCWGSGPHPFHQLRKSSFCNRASKALNYRCQITYRIFKRFEPVKLLPLSLLLLLIPSLLVHIVYLHVHSLPLAVTATFASFYALILIFTATYRLSPFHPLAHYPGPIKTKLSKLTMSYIASTGKQHVYYRKLHDQYGDIVRVG